MKIIIIIPTYNEKNTISVLLDALARELKEISNYDLEILIVDGNSSDGTTLAVKEKMKARSNLRLIVEDKKQGLGMAYLLGMKYATKQLGADAIIEFDGDGQHDPKDIKRLIAEFDRGYDYVIGSRYVLGGQIPEEWEWHRKLLSRFGSLFIRAMLRLPARDCTSGLKLSRVKNFVENLPLEEDKLLSKRHAYKIHFLYEMIRRGAKFKEIPIKFLKREKDNSKSSLEDFFESLRVCFILFFRDLSR